MKCPRCQQENPPQARFCLGCGARLALACSACGTELPGGARFCLQCGQPVGGQSPAPQAKFGSPESYTPKHLAERILTSKAAIEGERKQVTVLFADLKGSMELVTHRDPEEARKIIDPVLELIIQAVHRYEGTVNQVMGDGIMALFGAPLAHEDHAVRACYAALAMQSTIRRYNEDVRRSHGIEIQIRVGLNSGEVVVRAIGSDLHMDYTAVGQATHLAARMEQLATPGTIRLTGETLRLVEGFVEVIPLGPVPVKGLEDPVEVFELTGARSTRRRFEAAAARGLSRFVGRQTEIDTLQQALERARAGHGQVVAPVGEPGIGKSRLFWEFTHSHRTQGWLVLESGSVSYGKTTAYLPIIDLLKAYFRVQDRDDHREIREKIIGKLLALDRTLEATLPAFLALLDVPLEDPEWERLDPPRRRQRTLEAIKRLLLRESQVQPLLLVVEDLHWIDSETQAALDSLVEHLPTARILLLVNYRPEYQHGWGSKSYYTQLPIAPLPPDSARELLRALLGDDPGLHPLKQLLIDRTEGNPFFLEESVRTLVETRVLVGERGAYRVAVALPAIQVPRTVQAVLAARIDRLPAEEKRLLQSAAVVGKDVPFALLQAIGEEPVADLQRGLSHLQAAEFLYETSLFPESEYTFKHALTHEVAYGGLLQEQRRILHARIMEAIERLYRERLPEHVERLAHHAFRGEMWEKALIYFRQAGAKAFARSANQEAVTCFEHALEVLKRLPESRDALEQAIDIRFELRSALLPLGEARRILDYLREAETLAEGLQDQRRLAWVSTYMTIYFLLMADSERAIGAGQRAVTIAREVGDFALRVVGGAYLGQAYRERGDYQRAIELLRETVDLLKDDLIHERLRQAALPSVYSRTILAISRAECGEFSEATAVAEEAIGIGESLGQPFSLILASLGLGYVYVQQGQFDKVIPLLGRVLELIRLWGIPVWFPWTAALQGYAVAFSGHLADAVHLLEQALDRAVALNFMFGHSLWVAWVAEVHLLAGRIAEASRLAEQALTLCRDRKERGYEAWALRLLGEIASQKNPPDTPTATEHYRQAMGLADELGMPPLMARCHLGLGKLYSRTGNPGQAQEHLTTSKAMFREMHMQFWLAKTEAEMRELP